MSEVKGSQPERPPISIERLLECVHCGLCLPACPTYVELGNEADSPRGRIHWLRAVAEQGLSLDAAGVRHLDLCLGCRACESACPSGVRYGEVLEEARVFVERSFRRPWWDRWRRRLVVELFAHPARLATLLLPIRLADRLGAGGWLRRLPLLEFLPPLARAASWKPSAVFAARGPRKHRVALLRGCVARVLFPQVEAALVRLLVDQGCEVIVPPKQGCCGALAAHQGDKNRAARFVREFVAAFAQPVDAILVTAAGCGAFLRCCAHWLDAGALRKQAEHVQVRVRDATEFLAALDLPAPPRPFGIKVAYHHACHLVHAQGIRDQPEQLLRLVGAELVPLEEADMCCGSAGSYNLLEAGLAQRLGERKARNILGSGAEVVAVANPGCSLQIQAALRRAGSRLPVLHPIEILVAAYYPDAFAPPSFSPTPDP
ncbi:MAG: glycolate oxidase iron-sulfur subunit [Candidatus Binatia bacterium]|nr:MAG: glycolate oxidase iron-sulfur subunit [Candidatus Binatia bacterium]